MYRQILVIFLSLFFFAGCARIPKHEARCLMEPIPPLDCTTQTAFESGSFCAGDFPNPNWWEIFGDQQLSNLICRALSANPTLQKVAARVRTAEAEAKIQKSKLLPTLGLTADLNWQHLGEDSFFRAFTPVIPPNLTEYKIDLDFSYEIDFWGKNRNTYRAAIGIAKAEAAEKESAVLMLTTSLASVYFKWQIQVQQLLLLKEEEKILSDFFHLTTSRQEHALDTTTQSLAAQEQVLRLQKIILLFEQNVQLEMHTLKMLLGEGPDTCEEIQNLCFDAGFMFPLPCQISSDLLARRPDLMAFIWRVEAAAHLVGAAKADFYPRVDLMALAGFDSLFIRKLFQWENRAYSVIPAFHLPIFTGGRLRANLRAKQAEFEEAIYVYNEGLLRAVKEVADQIVTLHSVDKKIEVEERLVQNKEHTYALMRQRYENDVGNLLDQIQSQNALIQEQFENLDLQYQRLNAALQLIKALGGGYCNREVPFD